MTGRFSGDKLEAEISASTVSPLTPVPSSERIQALDVVRGFALIGVFLMNIEYFNREMSSIGLGMPAGLTGLNWLASWFIAYFVQGKFWTIFSMLFGMGFAVMLTRAERADRSFIGPYLRRILALATFGAAHFIFIWAGDILFSYAVAAGALLILLYGRWKPILFAIAVLAGVAFIPRSDPAEFNPAAVVAGGVAFVGLISLYLRNERQVNVRGWSLPLFSLILLVLAAIGIIAAAVLWALPNGPKEPRIPVTIISIAALAVGFLSAKFHNPVELRALRLGVSAYVLLFAMMTIFGVVQYFKPPEPDAPARTASVPAKDTRIAKAEPAKPDDNVPAKTADLATDKTEVKKDAGQAAQEGRKEPEKTEAEKAAEKKAARVKRLARRLEDRQEEIRVLTKGTFVEAVQLRARIFPEKAAGDAGFASVLICMFLIGVWFVRSGVIEKSGEHLALFRKFAFYALPFGIGVGLLGSLIAVSHIPGDDHDGYQIALGLAMLGNLPACLGYVGMVVMMLHGNSVFSKISILAPAGRMALTNYLTQSLVSTYIFYGYGLGHWGLPRVWQVVYVAVFFALQVMFSHWWLARYRYGPMEWLWRGFTYRQIPAMRL